MTIQNSVAVRNANLDSIETTIGTAPKVRIYSGAQPANCAAARTGTLLAEFTLASDWAGAASAGSKAFSNLPLTTTAVAGAPTDAGHYAIMNSAGTTCHEQGTVTATDGGGDMIIDNVSIATGQTVNITAWTKTAPGA